MKKKVFVVEDHPIVRQGLVQLINQEADLEVVGNTVQAGEAFVQIERLKPDIAVVDLSLDEGIGGLQLIKDIKKANLPTVTLVLSMHDEAIYAERALRSGAKGYVMKAEATEKVLAAIRKILSGDIYLSEKMTTHLLHKLNKSGMRPMKSALEVLSDREAEVFHLIGAGSSTRDIAGKLNLSIKTIETYREHIKDKLHLKNGTELVHFSTKWTQSSSHESFE